MNEIGSGPAKSRVRVLIVDDSRFARRIVQLCLERSGRFEIVGHAENGRDALNLVQTLHPDVVTLDLDMPLCDGREFLRSLPQGQTPPVVCVTALPVGADEIMGPSDHSVVPKDFSAGSLDLSMFEMELVEKVWSAATARKNG